MTPDLDSLPAYSTRGIWLGFLAVFLVLAGVSWLNDSVTLQGHWTLYTARCDGGAWHGTRCTGRLVAAERHEFVANKANAVVTFTIIGATTASGTLSKCTIKGGRDWTCQEASGEVQPITLRLSGGRLVSPVDSLSGARPISKWKWLLLRLGIPVGSDATA